MIRYLKRNKIDIEKYDACVERSVCSRIYAFSWFLDSVTDSWDVLIKDDYKAVMPLPIRKKYGINYIYLPPWVQQLGVFSEEEIGESMLVTFLKAIPGKYVLVDYYFNSENKFSHKSIKKRDNYILALNRNSDQIRKGYNKNRGRISNKDFTSYRIDKKGDATEFLKNYTLVEKKYKSHKDSFEKLQNLLNSKNECIHIWNVFKKNEFSAGLLWTKDNRRITYLVPVYTEAAKKDNIPTFLVNELISEYQNSDYILDLEGSMNDGIARFYKSFGAEKEGYFWFKRKGYSPFF